MSEDEEDDGRQHVEGEEGPRVGPRSPPSASMVPSGFRGPDGRRSSWARLPKMKRAPCSVKSEQRVDQHADLLEEPQAAARSSGPQRRRRPAAACPCATRRQSIALAVLRHRVGDEDHARPARPRPSCVPASWRRWCGGAARPGSPPARARREAVNGPPAIVERSAGAYAAPRAVRPRAAKTRARGAPRGGLRADRDRASQQRGRLIEAGAVVDVDRQPGARPGRPGVADLLCRTTPTAGSIALSRRLAARAQQHARRGRPRGSRSRSRGRPHRP